MTREEKREWQKAYYLKNRDSITSRRENYYARNPEKLKEAREKAKIKRRKSPTDAIYRLNNKEKISRYSKTYRVKNKDKLNTYHKLWRNSTPERRLSHLIRTRTLKLLKRKNFKNSSRFGDYIGCTVEELARHIESKFTEGMHWNNQGEWHIDHIIPLSSARTEEEVYKLNHYTNLQPLWGLENLQKGAELPPSVPL